MKFIRLVLITAVATFFVHSVTIADNKTALTKPNILVIVSDNQGWKDIGYNGSEIRTPTLDRLATDGVRLDQFYAYPLCSPTRAALMSGRAPSRFGIVTAIAQRSKQALPPETVTLADTLHRGGYETAITGKWHLGLRPEVGPLQYGFDYSYGFLHGAIDKYTHRYKNGDRTWHRNDQFIDEEGHALDLITAEAIKFIERQRDRPFFLYVPFGAAHPPLQEPAEWVEPYRDEIATESRRLYAAAVTHMDAGIGDLIATLDRTGQRENTIVIFFSDNGPFQSLPKQPHNYEGRFGPYPVLGDNGPLRGWLGDVYDGGVRTPALVNWPGVLKPTVVDQVTSVLDLYPTLASLADARVSDELKLEGRNIWPMLTGQGETDPIVLYWRRPDGRQAAVRDGDWKLVVDLRTGDTELFNMKNDPYEKQNLSSKHPSRVDEMRQVLKQQMALDPA